MPGVKPLPRRLQPVPLGKPMAAPRRGHRRSARGTFARRRSSGRHSQRWGMPRRGAGVRGECPRRRADNNKEGNWVRALAGLRGGLAGPTAPGAAISWHPPSPEGGKGMGMDPGELRSRTAALWEPGCLSRLWPHLSLTL